MHNDEEAVPLFLDPDPDQDQEPQTELLRLEFATSTALQELNKKLDEYLDPDTFNMDLATKAFSEISKTIDDYQKFWFKTVSPFLGKAEFKLGRENKLTKFIDRIGPVDAGYFNNFIFASAYSCISAISHHCCCSGHGYTTNDKDISTLPETQANVDALRRILIVMVLEKSFMSIFYEKIGVYGSNLHAVIKYKRKDLFRKRKGSDDYNYNKFCELFEQLTDKSTRLLSEHCELAADICQLRKRDIVEIFKRIDNIQAIMGKMLKLFDQAKFNEHDHYEFIQRPFVEVEPLFGLIKKALMWQFNLRDGIKAFGLVPLFGSNGTSFHDLTCGGQVLRIFKRLMQASFALATISYVIPHPLARTYGSIAQSVAGVALNAEAAVKAVPRCYHGMWVTKQQLAKGAIGLASTAFAAYNLLNALLYIWQDDKDKDHDPTTNAATMSLSAGVLVYGTVEIVGSLLSMSSTAGKDVIDLIPVKITKGVTERASKTAERVRFFISAALRQGGDADNGPVASTSIQRQ